MAAFTAQNIGMLQTVEGVKLSPDGSKLVYHVTNAYKDGEHASAALWYSPDTSKDDSAKQITSGIYNDGEPVWHPDAQENTIYFLSDRHKQGGPKQIYQFSLDGPGEPSLINNIFKEKKSDIKEFQVSPDGRYIAFCSADEPSPEEERKKSEKDDARVWGEREGYSRLRIYTLSTGEVRTLVDEQTHAVISSWSPDSKELLYFLRNRPGSEAKCESTSLWMVSARPSYPAPTPKLVTTFTRFSASDLVIWPSPAHREIFSIQTYSPQNIVDAMAVYLHPLDTTSSSPQHSEQQRFCLGKTEDAAGLIDLQTNSGEFVIAVASGMKTRIDVVSRKGTLFTLFETSTSESLRHLDVKKVGDRYILALARSSGPEKEPLNVRVLQKQIHPQDTGGLGVPALSQSHHLSNELVTANLSSHFSWMLKSKIGNIEPFTWKGEDGVLLDGMAWFPEGMNSANITQALPTILHVHGGPYGRNVPEFQTSVTSWQPTLAEQGYLVLSPNYRGGSGRGHEFARAAYHGMGTTEWSDVNAMIDEAVKRGLANKDKLAIGGWSQGGFLTAWGVSQTKNKFQCGIVGAGVTDWGSLAAESDVPDFEADLGGGAPWMGEAANLRGDAIRHVKGIETAMLILHGEKDERVPIGQAIGFHRGLRRMSKYPERHTLVIYPREGHGFTERKHAEDVIKRVIAHYEAWLK